jgi:hypothetical protein
MAGEDASFTFVTDGVETAVEQARAAVDGKKASVMGADVPQQAINQGRALGRDPVHLIPVLLDEGGRLSDHLGTGRIDLERARVVESPEGVTHLKFRVKK